jgi:hypothetical protein
MEKRVDNIAENGAVSSIVSMVGNVDHAAEAGLGFTKTRDCLQHSVTVARYQ